VAGVLLAGASMLLACGEQEKEGYAAISTAVDGSCARCHDAARIGGLIDDVVGLDASNYTAMNFPSEQFPDGVVANTATELASAQEVNITADMPNQQAWIIHELNELEVLLGEDVPPDFTTEAKMKTFIALEEGGHYEGCEIISRLGWGRDGNPEGMTPLWAEKLMELLGDDAYVGITEDERDAISEYAQSEVPGGVLSCVGEATGDGD